MALDNDEAVLTTTIDCPSMLPKQTALFRVSTEMHAVREKEYGGTDNDQRMTDGGWEQK